jgi:hypothetical protein
MAIGFIVLLRGCATPAPPPPATVTTSDDGADATTTPTLEPFSISLDGTSARLDMVPVPAGPDGATTIWISRTEIPWDLYDLFVFGLDEPAGDDDGADAVTRPSKPYIAMDRGYGHAGYPAISMSHHGAEMFCRWLGARTGRAFRLPTESEWRRICAAAAAGAPAIDARAWHAGNANGTTHPVGSKVSDGLGLVDLLGNASEWCTGDDGKPVTLGGTYLTPVADLDCALRVEPIDDWNASDPQFPKSIWWLADAGFVGFRVVCVPERP